MALEMDPDVAKKITKLAMAGYAIMFLIARAQPLPAEGSVLNFPQHD